MRSSPYSDPRLAKGPPREEIPVGVAGTPSVKSRPTATPFSRPIINIASNLTAKRRDDRLVHGPGSTKA